MLCKNNSVNVRKLGCNENVCSSCLEMMLDEDVKRFKCANCNGFHLVNTRFIANSRVKQNAAIHKQPETAIKTRATANAIKSMTPSEIQSVAIVKDIDGNNREVTREKFNFESCLDPVTKKLLFTNRINLAYLNLLNPSQFLLRPINHSEILLYNNENFFIIRQNGEIASQSEVRDAEYGPCVEIQVNTKYIYALYEMSRYKYVLAQYDHGLKFVKRLNLNVSYYSMSCSEAHVYISGWFYFLPTVLY